MVAAIKASREVLEPGSDFRPFPLEEYEARWARVHDAMAAKGYEAAVVWGKTSGVYERAGDILYLANFFSTHSGQEPDTVLWNGRAYGAVILQRGEVPELITDEAEARFDIIATDRFQGLYDPIKGVADSIKARGVEGRVALVGSDFLPMKYWLQLETRTPGIEWVPDDDLVRNVRRIKSPLELDLFREAGELVTRAHTALMEALIAGESEGAAAGAGGRILLEGGGSWHRIAISHGDTSAYLESDPLTGFSTRTPNKGDIVHGFIYGPILKGYWLDPGRTAVCGRKPDADQRALIECLVDVMNKHSNGCMWEAPYIEPRLCTDEEVFEENMVASVEGFFTDEKVGTAVFETNYIVTKDGVEEITPVPHLFW
jgi:Xaa-Pro dipeptidase